MAILGISLVTPVAKGLDIERISMCSQKDHLDGTAVIIPWRFEVDIHLGDPGTLHYIDVIPPTGGTPFTIYEDSGDWEYHSSPTLYPTLTALQAVYPTGQYTFDFRDSSNVQLNYVELNYSDIDNPGSPVDFTYPSDNGQTGISTNPTLTWTIDSGAGDVLGMALYDDYGEIYRNIPAPMETLSWQPGPLDLVQNYWLYVTVAMVKDWAGAIPTMTVDGDEFEYLLHIGYMNKIGFTTAEVVAIVDIVDTITTKTKWINCYLWLPDDDVADIDLDSIRLGGSISAVRASVRKKQQMLVVKFSASELNLDPRPEPYSLTVSGELIDETTFAGSDEITVIQKGGKKN